jgi:hypothetical protein
MATAGDFILWIRVGDMGEYEEFDSLDDALEYLNGLRVGQVTGWVQGGFNTPNYHGHDYISCYWGGLGASYISELDADDKEVIENGLEENYL